MAQTARVAVGILAGLFLIASEAFTDPQSSNMAEESIKHLVVMVESKLAEQERIGSGIIFGFEPDRVYIVTADHVVRQAAREADEVTIRLYWAPDKHIKAKLLSHRDTLLDVAVLSVSDLSGLKAKRDELPFDRMGDPNSLQRGDAIYLLGNPNGKSWRVNTTPEKFAETRGDSLEFESNLIAPGHSGGALLNSERELIGMLRSDQAPYGEAVSIPRILKRLKDWGYPVNLRQMGVQVSSGDFQTCATSTDGVARCWGHKRGSLVDIGTIQGTKFKSISVGSGHVCGTDWRGQAYCVGNNSSGQLGKGTIEECCIYSDLESAQHVRGELTFLSVSAGVGHTCGVTTGASVYCWGSGKEGQLGNGSRDDSPVPVKISSELEFDSVSAGWLYTCGLTTSGSLYCWGGDTGTITINSRVPLNVSDGLTFKSISAGMHHLCGVTPRGVAYCTGDNEYGQLGNGSDTRYSEQFVPVSGGLTFRILSASIGGFTCGLTTKKAVYCWGYNDSGQLGNGSTKNTNKPIAVSGGLTFVSISAGTVHVCGVTTEDSIYCWGSEMGSKVKSAVPVRVIAQ